MLSAKDSACAAVERFPAASGWRIFFPPGWLLPAKAMRFSESRARACTLEDHTMTTEAAIRILAGSMILLSLLLYQFVSPWGLLLAAFVALNLIQSSFTGFCPAEKVFVALGIGTKCTSSEPHAS